MRRFRVLDVVFGWRVRLRAVLPAFALVLIVVGSSAGCHLYRLADGTPLDPDTGSVTNGPNEPALAGAPGDANQVSNRRGLMLGTIDGRIEPEAIVPQVTLGGDADTLKTALRNAGLSAPWPIGTQAWLIADLRAASPGAPVVAAESAAWVAEVPDLHVLALFSDAPLSSEARVVAIELRGTPRRLASSDTRARAWRRHHPWSRLSGTSYQLVYPSGGAAVVAKLGRGRWLITGQEPALLITPDESTASLHTALLARRGATSSADGTRTPGDAGGTIQLSYTPLDPAVYLAPEGYWPPTENRPQAEVDALLGALARLFPPVPEATGTDETADTLTLRNPKQDRGWRIYERQFGGWSKQEAFARRWAERASKLLGLDPGVAQTARPSGEPTDDALDSSAGAGASDDDRNRAARARQALDLWRDRGVRATAPASARGAGTSAGASGGAPGGAPGGEAVREPDADTGDEPRLRLTEPLPDAADGAIVVRRATLELGYEATQRGKPVTLRRLTVFARLVSAPGAPDTQGAWNRRDFVAPAGKALPARDRVTLDLAALARGEAHGAPDGVPDGVYELDFAGETLAGETTSGAAMRSVRATVTVDTTPPDLVLVPANRATPRRPLVAQIGAPFTLRWVTRARDLSTREDAQPVRLEIDLAAGGWRPITQPTGVPNSGALTWTPSPEHAGLHRLRLTVRDRAGWETSVEIPVRVEHLVPECTLVHPPSVIAPGQQVVLGYRVRHGREAYPRALRQVTLWWRHVSPDGAVTTWNARRFAPDDPVTFTLSADGGHTTGAIDLTLTATDVEGHRTPAPTMQTLPLAALVIVPARPREQRPRPPGR